MQLPNAKCVCNMPNKGPCPVCKGRKAEKPKTIKRLPAMFGRSVEARIFGIRINYTPTAWMEE